MIFTNFLGLFRSPTRATANVIRSGINHVRVPSGGSISAPPSYRQLSMRSHLSADAATLSRATDRPTVRSNQSTDTVRHHSNSAPSTVPPTYRSLPEYLRASQNRNPLLQAGEEGVSVESARRRYAEVEDRLVHGAERENNADPFHLPGYAQREGSGPVVSPFGPDPASTGPRRVWDIFADVPRPSQSTANGQGSRQARHSTSQESQAVRLDPRPEPQPEIDESMSMLQVVRRRPGGRRQTRPDVSNMFEQS